MTLVEVAEYLRLSPATLYEMTRTRRGPRGRKVGRRWVWLRSEVIEWLRSGGNGTEPRRLPPRRQPAGAAPGR